MKGSAKEDLSEYHGPDQIISSYEMEEMLIQRRQDKELVSYSSGIPLLDKYTEGFREGELIIISGPTGEGKTLLCQTFTEHFSNKGHYPLFFSFEMPPEFFLRCFPSVPYFYLPTELKPYSWDWFCDRCEENRLKHTGKIIIIDHLHFLLHFFQSGNPSLEIGRLVRLLKRLAVDYHYLVILIAHVGKLQEGEKASMRRIRDSSFITQEADTVIMVQRVLEEDTDRNAILTVDKCRWTGAFNKIVKVKKIDGYLREIIQKS